MTRPITSENLVAEFLAAFPEFEGAVAEVLGPDSNKEFINYTVVGAVFLPRFKESFQTAASTAFLHRSAEFVENVCRSGDDEAVNIIWVKLFEWLLGQPEKLRTLWPMLGPATRRKI